MKKFLATLLSVLIIVTGVAFVAACNKDDGVNVLKTYILKQEGGNPIDEDFELPSKIGGKDVSWTSSDTSAIKIENGDDCYIAKVTMASETKNVTLTVTQGENEKKFNVTVTALDVYYLLDHFKLAQNELTVYDDFDLPTSYTYKGATAEISWDVDAKYSDYITLNADKNKCLVNPTSLNPRVELKAIFKYNNEPATARYSMTVSLQRTHLEEIEYWYNNTGVTIEMSGYVVEIALDYKDGYAALYMVDDDLCAGFYLYNVGLDADTAKLLKPGVHVTATGTTNQNYNGLIETNNKTGTLVVDTDKDGNVITIDSIDDSLKGKEVYAIDNDLLAGVPATIYNQSRMVSLDKWTVSEVSTSVADGSTTTLFKLTKGDVTDPVTISK